MRVRAVVVSALLLLPAGLSAQILPVPGAGRRGPLGPTELPRQPEAIARQLAYTRSHVSIESYPLITRVETSAISGVGQSSAWTSVGTGTRAEYRVARNVSATLDVTSSFLGSPVLLQTAELGTRLRPERSERRLYPFVDVRVGYFTAYDRNLGSLVGYANGSPTTPGVYGARYSQGFGGGVGVGMEYALTNTFSLTTGGTFMQSRMTTHDFEGSRTVDPNFRMRSYRYTLGIRYNPVRSITTAGTDRL